jgi:hypothetical protein
MNLMCTSVNGDIPFLVWSQKVQESLFNRRRQPMPWLWSSLSEVFGNSASKNLPRKPQFLARVDLTNLPVHGHYIIKQSVEVEVEVTLRLTVSMSWHRVPLWDLWPDIISCRNVTVWNWRSLSGGRPLWREDGSAICSAITQLSESPRTHNHILQSHLRLPQPGGPGPHIYIAQEDGGPVIPPGTGFPLRRLLRLAGPRWRYSNPPHYLEGQVPVYIAFRNRMVQS